MSKTTIGENFKFDLNKLGIGQQNGDDKNKPKNLTAEEISVFNALDTNKNGSLDSDEIDNLKAKIAEYTKDDNDFSLKDAKKVAKELGVKAKPLMSLLQKLCNMSESTDKTVSTQYNKDGTISKETVRDKDKTVTTYYDNNKVVSRETEYYSAEGNSKVVTETYNNGKLVNKMELTDDICSNTQYRYNEENELTTAKTTSSNYEQTTQYNKDGSVSKETVRDKDKTVTTYYDDNKVASRETEYFSAEGNSKVVIETYDNDEKLLNKIEIDNE